MYKTNMEISVNVVLSSLFILVLCLHDVTSENDSTSGTTNQPTTGHPPTTTHPPTTRKFSLKEDVEVFLDDLEKFDRSEKSCATLTSAIGNFLRFTRTGVTRRHELGSLLFAYAKMRPKVFTDIQDERTFRDPKKEPNANIVHTLIRRVDGTVFLFCMGSDVKSVLTYMMKPTEKGGIYYRWVKGEVKHTVGVRLRWKKKKGQRVIVNATYLCDVFDYSKAINVTTEVSLK